MIAARMLFAAILTIGLSGCFTSDTPLISGEDADFPFETIVYQVPDDDTPIQLVHQGDAYLVIATDSDDRSKLRLMDIGDGLYFAQAQEEKGGEILTLYSVLKVDLEMKRVESHLALGKDEYATKGLRQCDDGNLCIDDLDVYLDLARTAIAAGNEPDVIYEIIATN